MKKDLEIKIGFFTIGLQAYWAQMKDMKPEIEGYAEVIINRLSFFGEVINAGIIDNTLDARKTEELFIKEDIDILIIHVGTYGLSSTVAACIRRLQVPIITLHLQPIESFKKDTQAEYALPKNVFSAAGEIGAALNRMGRKFYPIFGQLKNDERPWEVLQDFLAASKIKKKLRNSNVGLIGNVYAGMADIYADGLLFINKLGINLEIFEIGNLRHFIEKVSEIEAEEKLKSIKEKFIFDFDAKKEHELLLWNAKVAVGLEKFAKYNELDAIAYHYSGYPQTMAQKIGYSMTVGGALLASEGIACAEEGDLFSAISILILQMICKNATQAEFKVADFKEGVNYLEHTGPGNICMSPDKPILKLMKYFHGKSGSGFSCQFNIEEGPITLLSLTAQKDNSLKLLIAEGLSVSGTMLEDGEMCARIRFKKGIVDFAEKWMLAGPSHHSALGTGFNENKLIRTAQILDLNYEII